MPVWLFIFGHTCPSAAKALHIVSVYASVYHMFVKSINFSCKASVGSIFAGKSERISAKNTFNLGAIIWKRTKLSKCTTWKKHHDRHLVGGFGKEINPIQLHYCDLFCLYKCSKHIFNALFLVFHSQYGQELGLECIHILESPVWNITLDFKRT